MSQTALLIIDMQADMQHRIDAGYDHVHGDAGTVITRLAEHARWAGVPVIHVRHSETDPASPFHPSAPGYLPLPCDREQPGEAVFVKTSSSAFATTGLEAHLRQNGIDRLIVTGAVAGFCVTSTVRAASDLGFQVTVVREAVLGFGLPHAGLSARQIFDVSLGLLAADFSQVVDADAALALIGAFATP